MSQTHLKLIEHAFERAFNQLIERPQILSAEENENYYEQQALDNAVLADRYRLQSLVYLNELQKANKALTKRARQVKNLRAQTAHKK